jgi:hypothetical protein
VDRIRFLQWKNPFAEFCEQEPSVLSSTHPYAHPSTCLPVILQRFVGPWLLFQFLDLFTQSVWLLGREMSPSQGRYLHTGQHRHRVNAYRHPCLKWDLNRHPSFLPGEDSSCLRPREHCDRPVCPFSSIKVAVGFINHVSICQLLRDGICSRS